MIKIKAHAKINWMLAVLGCREDGYHELDTIMQGIALYDLIELKTLENAECDELSIEGPQKIKVDDDNTVLKAVRAFREKTNILDFFSINIEKHIPSEAGLGGGSSDAAAVLRALQKRYSMPDEKTLNEIALSIGADVPFCLLNSAARCRGIGEKIEPFQAGRFCLLIVKPNVGVSTGKCFRLFDKMMGDKVNQKDHNDKVNKVKQALQSLDLKGLSRSIYNDLQEVSIHFEAEIGEILKNLRNHGAVAAMMSGSGSACFGVFENEEDAKTALTKFSDDYFKKVVYTC